MTLNIRLNAHAAILAKYGNRHGLIAGATGTGKTVTLQKLCEEFSRIGTPVFVADVKGDIAGLAIDGKGKAAPVALWDVFGTQGTKLTLTLESLGVDLLARMLELSDAQKGVLEFCFMRNPGLATLADLSDELRNIRDNATKAALIRALRRFERMGGMDLIGKDCFDLKNFFEYADDGRGVVNILAADRLMQSPSVYATLMVWVLDQLFQRMPEAGDLDAPRFVIFLDEAHLIFQDAPPSFVQKLERTVRLIRSKGVGVYFVTQSPADLPSAVLGQLGNRIQHALRGATVQDQKAIRAAAETMPINPAIDAAKTIGTLGTGQALVSFLQEGGIPSPVQIIKIELPACRLGALSPEERAAIMLKQKSAPTERQSDGGINPLAFRMGQVAALPLVLVIGWALVSFLWRLAT